MKRQYVNLFIKQKTALILFLAVIIVLALASDAAAQRRDVIYRGRGGFVHVSPRPVVRAHHGPYITRVVGTRISALPFGYVSFRLGGLDYYYYGGIYYRYYPADNVYVVVEKPKGTESVSSLKFDQVKLYDGSTLEGVFVGATDTTVTLKIGDKNHEINIGDIVSINFAPPVQEK